MGPMIFVQFAAGLALLIAGGESLVRGASRLAAVLGVSPLVIGLTVVAFGTSSPELAVSVEAALSGQADIALGNVVGSCILNVLLILGLSSLISPLVVAQRMVRVDVPLMIAVGLVVCVFAMDRLIMRLEGVVLFAGIVGYVVVAVIQSRRESRQVEAEYAQEYAGRGRLTWRSLLVNTLLIVAGLIALAAGSAWLVEAAVNLAVALHVGKVVIGLTVVSIGTSLPEIVTTVIAGLRGERDIAVGNIVGSNLFNLLAVLGAAGIVAPQGIAVPQSVLQFDLPVMVVTMVACLPIFFTGYRIARWEGALFLGYYAAYTAYLILDAMRSDSLRVLSDVILYFAAPLTVITLAVVTWRSARRAIRDTRSVSDRAEGADQLAQTTPHPAPSGSAEQDKSYS
ncbi:MAG: calcium/sodium antiporter [Anaerolineae bacterium]|nr:calcium/sodium antiporter [Thermoflexales bacterium]MDW8406636.1 calcium/sodium antiporter [Anaerolineae bacterium]